MAGDCQLSSWRLAINGREERTGTSQPHAAGHSHGRTRIASMDNILTHKAMLRKHVVGTLRR